MFARVAFTRFYRYTVSFFGTFFVSCLGFLLLLIAVFNLPGINTLSASMPLVASKYQVEIESKREKERLDIVSKAEIENKKDLAKKSGELNISGSCSDPIGWIENIEAKTQNSISYYVPKNRLVKAGSNPKANPESFVIIVCSSTDKINYLDKRDGRYKKIDNTVKATNSTKDGLEYAYTNTANDFGAYFHKDPSRGWLFVSGETTVKVVKVQIGGLGSTGSTSVLKVNPAILRDNTVTYPEILPDIDLVYTVTNRGVSKSFIVKSKVALANDLSKIVYTLETGNKLNITKKAELKDSPQNQITDQSTVQSIEIKDKNGKKSGISIIKPITFDATDINKIREIKEVKDVVSEVIKTKATNPAAPILENAFEVSSDGKSMTIFTDKEYLNNPGRVFPITIDPETVAPGPMADTWVNSNTPNSVRTVEATNRAHLVVGGSAQIVGGYVAKARSWLKFAIPGNVESATSVIEAKLLLRQYDGNNMRVEIKNTDDFDENNLTWNNQPRIYSKIGELWSADFACSTPGCSKVLASDNIAGYLRDQLGRGDRSVKIELNDDAEDRMLYRKAVFCSGDGRTDNHPCRNNTGQAPTLQIIYDNWKNFAPSTPGIFSPGNYSQNYLGCDKSSTGLPLDSNPNSQIQKIEGKCNQDKMSLGIGINSINDGNNGDRDEPYLTLDSGNIQSGTFFNLAARERSTNNQDHWKYFNAYSGIYGARSFVEDRYGVNSAWANGSDRLDNRMTLIDKSAPVQVTPQVVSPSNSPSIDYINQVIGESGVSANINNQGGITYLGRNPLDPNNTNLQVNTTVPTFSDDLLSRVRIKNIENTAVLDIANGNLNNGTNIGIWKNNPWMGATAFLMDGNRFRSIESTNGTYNTGFCLDAQSLNAGAIVHLWECHQGDNQDWFYDTVTSQIKLLFNQALCWEQARTYDDLSPVGITLQNCSTKTTQQFLIENLEEIRLKLKDTDRSMQHHDRDGNVNSTLKMNYDGLDWQKFYYSNLTKEIRNHSGQHCLTSTGAVNQGVSIQECQSGQIPNPINPSKPNPNQQWSFENGGVKSLNQSSLCLGVVGNKWQPEIAIQSVACNPGDGNQQIYKESVYKRYFGTLGLQSQSILTKVSTGANTILNPNQVENQVTLPYQTSPNIQYSNNPTSTNPKDKFLNQEDTFGITTKVLDRTIPDGNQLNQSHWSNIAEFKLDIDLPMVKDTAITQVGNNLQVNTTVNDKNLALAQVELIQNKDGLRATVAKNNNCNLLPIIVPVPCNITKTAFQTGDNKLVFNLPLSETTLSGKYEIQVRGYDRAGNISIDQATNNIVEIDRDPAKIAITYPVNQAWVNAKDVTIQGAVAGYNYDAQGNSSKDLNRDIKSLTIESLNSTTPAKVLIPLDDQKNWNSAVNLQPGNNQFRLETIDKAGNKSSWIGDSATQVSPATNNQQGKQEKWNINLDTSSPSVDKLEMRVKDPISGIESVIMTDSSSYSNISSSNPSFSFLASDSLMSSSNSSTIPNTSSGLNIGINPKGYYLTLIKEELEGDKTVNREIPLYFNDTIVSDPNPSPRLASNLDCTKAPATATIPVTSNPINCKISLANLVNGKYRLELKVVDRAGNSSSNGSNKSITSWSVNNFQQGTVNLDILPRTDTQANLLVTPINNATTTKGYTIVNAVSTPYSKNLICVTNNELRAQNLSNIAAGKTTLVNSTSKPVYQTGLNPVNCDLTQEVTANMIGQIASGLVLPIADVSYGISIIRYTSSNTPTLITASTSNLNTISYSNSQAFQGLDITTSLDGLNTAEEVQAVLNGTFNIGQLKKTQIKVTVPRGTEALDLDYGDLTNLNIQPNSTLVSSDQAINGITGTNGGQYGSTANGGLNNGLANPNNFNYNRIAVVNDLTANSSILNPNRDASIKQNQYQVKTLAQVATNDTPGIPSITIKNGNDLSRKESFNPCQQESCSWVINYYLPYYQSGGKYDIRVRMYKGENITEASRTISINGVIPTTPTLLRADKAVLTNQCRYNLFANPTSQTITANLVNQTANLTLSQAANCYEYSVIGNSSIIGSTLTQITPTIYTNSDRNKLIIGADPSTPIMIQVTKPDKTLEYLSRRTNAFGVLYLDYYTIKDGVYQFALVRNNQSLNTTTPVYTPSFSLVRDTVVPNLTTITTNNLSNQDSINPWARTGDNILFSVTTNEPIATGAVVGENGFRSPVIKELPSSTNPNFNCTSYTPIDLLAGTLVGGVTNTINNSSTPGIPTACHNDYLNSLKSGSSLTINRSQEGIYTPSILLTDIAGNSSLVTSGAVTATNLPQSQSNNQKAISKASLIRTTSGSTFYDYNDLFYATSTLLDTDSTLIKATLPINYPYTQETRKASLDFRLFLDNTAPTALNFDTSPYLDAKDGLQADGINPEKDRITNNLYTTRTNFNLFPRLEKNTRLILETLSTNTKNNETKKSSLDTKLVTTTPATQNIPYQSCTPTRQVNKQGLGEITTQDKEDCTLPIIIDNSRTSPINTASITSNGITTGTTLDTTAKSYGHSDNGIPSTRTVASYSILDLAGNRATNPITNSTTTNSLNIAYDTDKPLTEVEAQSRNLSENRLNTTTGQVGGASILEIQAEGAKLLSNTPIAGLINNKTSIDLKTLGEQQADLRTTLLSPTNKGVTTPTNTLPITRIDSNFQAKTTLNLGNNTRDDEANLVSTCTTISNTPIKNRRVGICQDGVYTIKQNLIDTAGNMSGELMEVVERDATPPLVPTLTATKSGTRVTGEKLGISLTGEASTKLEIKVSWNGTEKLFQNLTIPEIGIYTNTNLLDLTCGEITYTMTARLTDKVGNVSQYSTPTTQKSNSCLVCASNGNGALRLPVNNIAANEEFGSYKSGGVHYGMDFAAREGTNVYATASGIIVESLYGITSQAYGNTSSSMNYGAGNLITIKHSGGIFSTYFHLQNKQQVKVGDIVTKGQLIGYMGSTGNSTGSHLHFQVEDSSRAGFSFGAMRKASAVNPRQFMGDIGGNVVVASPEEVLECKGRDAREAAINLSKEDESWLWDNDTLKPIKAKFRYNPGIIAGLLKGTELISLENATPQIKKVIKQTDIDLGKDVDIDANSNKYNFYGLLPYKGQNVEITIVDSNDKELGKKITTLSDAQGRFRTGIINGNASGDRDLKIYTGNDLDLMPDKNGEIKININGRIAEQFTTKTNVQVLAKGDEALMTDNIWLDSLIKMSMDNCWENVKCEIKGGINDLFNYYTTKSNITQADKAVRYLDTGKGVESRIDVTSDRSNNLNFGITKDGKNRSAKLEIIKATDTDNKKIVPTDTTVWIGLHGWNGGFSINDKGTDKETKEYLARDIVDSLKAKTGDKTVVLLLDWREISHNGTPFDGGVCRAATWTRSLAEQIAKKLKDNGFTNQELNIVGHSLGTTLGSEISRAMGGNANLIALDPPNEGTCISQWPLPVQNDLFPGNTRYYTDKDSLREDYTVVTKFTRTFHGKGSAAGSRGYALSGDENIRVDFQLKALDIHGDVARIFSQIQDKQRLQNDTFSEKDTTGHNWLNSRPGWLYTTDYPYDTFNADMMIDGGLSYDRTKRLDPKNLNNELIIKKQ